MKAVRRAWIDRPLDRLRFELDRRPRQAYQPLPWIGLKSAARDQGVVSRWAQIEPLIARHELNTALDIGANVGFFSIALAMRGVTTLAIESEGKYFRMLSYAVKRLQLTNLAALNWRIDWSATDILPKVDATIFLSVWHHIVREEGFESAIGALESLWSHTRKVLVFDTGEVEMPADYRLPPFLPSPKSFLTEILEAACSDGEVMHLGQHQAFAPSGENCLRNLFAVVRRGSAQTT